jgi:geranylgeranyl reductase family protein
MECLDVIVAGAGPAGTAAAISAVRRGLRVVCVDKARFPRDKTCGDGLTTNALRLLEHLGLSRSAFDATGAATVAETVIVAPTGRRIVLPMPTGGLHAAVVERRSLDAALVAHAQACGVDVREGHEIEKVVVDDERVRVDDLEGRHLIAADGHWSPVRRMLEPDTPRDLGDWHAVRQYFDHAATDQLWVSFERDLLPGYAWVFPLPGGRANVGYGVLRRDGRSGKELKALWPKLLQRPALRDALGDAAVPSEQVHAWPIPTRYSPARLRHGARVLFVGDAAGVVDPMTGEGIAQAIETGMLAAQSIATGANYERLVHRALGRDLVFAGWLQRVLSYQWGARAALGAVDINDWTRRNFARWMWEDYPRALLGTPDRWRRGVFRAPGAWAVQ